MSENAYHIPVLLNRSIEGLNINPDGIYADLTFGGGGHSREILKHLRNGKLLAFDQDEDVIQFANELTEKYPDNFLFFQTNFEYFTNFIRYAGYKKINGILADLGVSSHQFNDSERGFSFRFDGKPDMRMNRKATLSALNILNEYNEKDLFRIFKIFGELKSAGKLTNAIIKRREKQPFNLITELNEIIDKQFNTTKKHKISAKIFQALRIETNKETEVLKKMLRQTEKCLVKGGRLVVLSYHSLEDRIVKNFIKYNDFDGKETKDIYGNSNKPFKEVNRKVIVPDENEIKTNNRARSAKLRIAEKIRE